MPPTCAPQRPPWRVQIEETRQNIDKISENVEEAKKLYSVILSAPIPEQSECGGSAGPFLIPPPAPRSPISRGHSLGGFPISCAVTSQRPKMTWSS